MLRAVTFDLWETLIQEDAACEAPRRDYRVREIGRLLRDAKLPVTDEALVAAHREVFVKMEPFWGSNLDISILEQAKMFIECALGGAVDGKLPPALLLESAKHYGEAAMKFPPKQSDGARAVLAATRASGLRLALLCNTGRTPGKVLRDLLAQFEMKAFFDVLCFSDEVRIRKPAAEFFTRALTRLGVRPDESVHVGDMPDTDLVGARAAGMRTVHVRRDGTPAAAAGLADHVIATISQLPEVLGRLMSSPQSAPTPGPPKTPRPSDFGKETTHL
jgi:putative hydrolase of the HAD superfamily